jgi:hypothetical protein
VSLVHLGAARFESTAAGDFSTRPGRFKTQTDQILFLRQMVNEDRALAAIRGLARDIVFRQYHCPARNEIAYALAIGQWVQANITYVRELPEEFQHAPATIAMGYGDCDDFAVVTAALLESIGIPAELVGMEWDTPEGRGFGHIFARAVFGTHRVPLDATLELPIDAMTDPIKVGLERGLRLRILVA